MASAKFTDAKDVKKTEAVEVMSMLNVINGFTDGSFKPADSVTRAQMAKMVAYIVAGGEDVGALYASANTFTDCNSHWAKGYIAYASKTGFVAGTGKGKFDPEGKVTGTQAAKMLLCALGFDAGIQGYTGANWTVNTLNDARDNGLLKGLEKVDMAAALSRENAAQMMLNALKGNMVKYTNKGGNIIVGDITINNGASTAEPIVIVDEKGDNYAGKDGKGNGYMQLCEKYFAELKLATSTDAYARPSHEWSYNKTSVTVADTAAYTFNGGKVADMIKTVQKDKVKIEDTVEVYLNGASKTTLDTYKDKTYGAGTVVEVFTNDKDETTRITVAMTYLAKITKVYTDKASTVADESALDVLIYGLGTDGANVSWKIAKTDEPKGFDAVYAAAKEDMFVLVDPTEGKLLLNIDLAEKVSGKMTTSGADYIKVGAEKYVTSHTYILKEANFDNTCDFYLDSFGNVIGSAETTAADEAVNYLFVSGSESEASGTFRDGYLKVKVTYLDGTTGVLNYEIKTATAEMTGKDVDANNDGIDNGEIAKDAKYYINAFGKKTPLVTATTPFASKFYSYKTNDNKDVILSNLVVTTDKNKADQSETVSFKKGEARVILAGTDFATGVKGVSNKDTVLTVVNNGKVSTYTGYSNFPTQEFKAADKVEVLYVYKTGTQTLTNVYVLGGEVSTSATYAYYTGKGEMTSDGQYYNFYIDGAYQSYVVDGNAPEKGNVYNLTVKDKKADISKVTMVTATVTSAGENYFVYDVNGAATYVYFADKAQVYNVTDAETITTATLSKGYEVSFFLGTTGDDTGKAIVIYVTNDQN